MLVGGFIHQIGVEWGRSELWEDVMGEQFEKFSVSSLPQSILLDALCPQVSSSGGAEEFSDRVARGGSVATVPVATALSEVLHRLGLALLATVEGLYRSSALAPALLMELRLKMMQLYGVTLVGVGQQKARLDADIEGSPYELVRPMSAGGGDSDSEDETPGNSFGFRSPNWLASAALGNGEPRTCFMPASPVVSAFSELQSGIPGRSDLAAAVVTDRPFRSSELSPAQIEAEDSPHAPNAADHFFPTLRAFFGPQPTHQPKKCIDLLGATWAMNPSRPGVPGSVWNPERGSISPEDNVVGTEEWDSQIFGVDTTFHEKVRLSGPEGIYDHVPLLGLAHEALFRRNKRAPTGGSGPADLPGSGDDGDEDKHYRDLRREVLEVSLAKKGGALREKCLAARNQKLPDHAVEGMYTSYFDNMVNPSLIKGHENSRTEKHDVDAEYMQVLEPYIEWSEIVIQEGEGPQHLDSERLSEFEFSVLLAQAMYWGSPSLQPGVEAVGYCLGIFPFPGEGEKQGGWVGLGVWLCRVRGGGEWGEWGRGEERSFVGWRGEVGSGGEGSGGEGSGRVGRAGVVERGGKGRETQGGGGAAPVSRRR